MGNNPRGVACLRALIENEKTIAAVIAHPIDKESPKSGKTVREIAICNSIPLHQFENINHPDSIEIVSNYEADLIVMAGYNQILKKPFLNIPPLGCINLHGGKLPEYRGVAPLNWQMINGETTFGTAILFVDEGIDTGDIILQSSFQVSEEETIKNVIEKTMKIFPSELLKAIDQIEGGTVKRQKQDPMAGCYYTRRYPMDGEIHWDVMSAKQIYNLIRALTHPYPGAFTYYKGKKLYIWKASLLLENIKGIPGRVCLKRKNGIVVIAKDKGLLLETVQVQGNDVSTPASILKLGIDLV